MLKTVWKLLEELKMRRSLVGIVKFGPAEVSATSQNPTISRIFWKFSAYEMDTKNRFLWKISQHRSMVFFLIFRCSTPTWCFFSFSPHIFVFFGVCPRRLAGLTGHTHIRSLQKYSKKPPRSLQKASKKSPKASKRPQEAFRKPPKRGRQKMLPQMCSVLGREFQEKTEKCWKKW